MRARSRFVISSWALLSACARAVTTHAVTTYVAPSPSPAGAWDGIVAVPASAVLRIEIALDSTAAGWHGTALVPGFSAQPMALAPIEQAADTLILHLPASALHAVIRLHASAGGTRLDGTLEGASQGSVLLARAGTGDAAQLTAGTRRVEDSRRVAAGLANSVGPARPPASDPDSARLITSDIQLFWNAMDNAPGDSLAIHLQRDYLDRATVGVRDFIPGRIASAEDLAAYVRAHRADYDAVRAANLDVSRAEPAIRAAFRNLKALYPPAVFPDVYFVIGRFNSGGTSTNHGLIIGAEMYRDPARLPAIVSHELIHFQQHYPNATLLEHSFMEGSADFLGELISGAQINNDAYRYGMAHEAELWREFSAHFDDREFYPWMYGHPSNGRPNDLGYFIGYRIAQAYYQRTPDKRQAVRDIITARGNVREMLALSGYGPA
jgi:hypothetical protein